MNWSLAGQWMVVWIVVAVLVSPLIGRYMHSLRTRNEFQGLLARSKECERLEKLVQCADEYDAAKTDKERQRIFRKASELGFTDSPDREWEGSPFALDDTEQPHKPAA